jgi:hypothetical protein
VTASFGGSSIGELVGVSVSYGGGMPEGRGGEWKPLLGQVQVETLSGASTGQWGKLGTLAISGGGLSLTTLAVCTDVSAVAEINGITRYSYTFDLIG